MPEHTETAVAALNRFEADLHLIKSELAALRGRAESEVRSVETDLAAALAAWQQQTEVINGLLRDSRRALYAYTTLEDA